MWWVDLIWLSWAIYPGGEWIPRAFSRSIEILFCFANSQNTHYLRINLIEAQITELPIIRHEYAWLGLNCLKLEWALCSRFVQPQWKFTNLGFFVCHFDECPGHFHRVQMWGSRDPSWFQESIGVHKGRVNVHLLAWRDTEPAQNKRRTTDLILGLCVCVRARVCVFEFCTWIQQYRHMYHCLPSSLFPFCTYSCYAVTIPPSASKDIQSDSAFVMSPEGPPDCRNMKKMLAIAGVLSLLDAGALSYWKKKLLLNNGPNVFSFFF